MKFRVRVCCSFLLSLVPVQQAAAQLISVRTMPVAQADHFGIFPAQNPGMGGVRLALPDTLSDPFANPAAGGRLRVGRVFSMPALYSVSSSSGGGNLLPVGALFSAGAWFGAAAMAIQEIKPGEPPFFFPPPGPLVLPGQPGGGGVADPAAVPDMSPNRARGNALGALLFGRRLDQAGLSIAGSVQWAKMNAVDGVDLLYANSRHVNQSGPLLDARAGLQHGTAAGRELEATLLYRRLSMNHDVTFVDLLWDPVIQGPVEVPRLEANADRTNTWGFNVALRQNLGGTPWRLGLALTGNLNSHPGIPGYEADAPAEAGNSRALNLGLGLARVTRGEKFALDLIYEPARSHTWASNGASRTLDNRYRFSNGIMRMGFGWDLDPGTPTTGATLQLGLDVRAVRYRLDQHDLTTGIMRQMATSWTEWSPTWGLGFSFSSLDIRYSGRVMHGAGRPQFTPGGGFFGPCCFREGDAPATDNPFARSSGPEAFGFADVRLVTHQLTLSLPLR